MSKIDKRHYTLLSCNASAFSTQLDYVRRMVGHHLSYLREIHPMFPTVIDPLIGIIYKSEEEEADAKHLSDVVASDVPQYYEYTIDYAPEDMFWSTDRDRSYDILIVLGGYATSDENDFVRRNVATYNSTAPARGLVVLVMKLPEDADE